MLPVYQVRESQTGATELLIEPDAEGVQPPLRRQAGLKPSQVVRTLATEAEGRVDFVIDGLDDLTDSGEPAAQTLGPGLMAIALRRAQYLRPVPWPPACVRGLPLEALITDRGSQGRLPDAQASRVRPPAQREEGLGQRLILGAGRANAKAGHDPSRIARHEQMEAFVPVSARPGSQAAPRRLASRVGTAEPSRAS